MHGEGMKVGVEAELKAIKEMLAKVVGDEGKALAHSEPDGDELLDPSQLEEVLEDDAGGEGAEEVAEEATEEANDDLEMAAEAGAEAEPFDPSMVKEFFGAKPNADRKPLKGLKMGAVEVAVAPAGKKDAKKRA